MPYLESPEIIQTTLNSGVFVLEQKTVAPDEIKKDYDTDTGLTGAMGLNPVCARIHLAELPGPDLNHASLSMTLVLSTAWHGKDAFKAAMKNDHGIDIQEREYAYGCSLTFLTVRGPDNIQKAGEFLRTQFEESAQQGADIFIPVVHPALLGEAIDKVIEITSKRPISAQPYGWAEAAASYGWR